MCRLAFSIWLEASGRKGGGCEHPGLLRAAFDAGDRKRASTPENRRFESRRGPLEGLKEIADDPDYLAEWQKRTRR